MNRISASILLSCAVVLAGTTCYAAKSSKPASKEWVMAQIAANQRVLTASDWQAVCQSGSATSSSGCYGNVSSTAFTKVSDHIGGFTTYANINPQNISSSVFIKSFFGGTSIPTVSTFIQVDVSGSAARCGLFTQAGFGLGLPGVATNTPSNGSSSGDPGPISASVVSINNASASIVAYNNNPGGSLSNVAGSPNSDPLYLVCAGYSPANGSTAAALTVSAT